MNIPSTLPAAVPPSAPPADPIVWQLHRIHVPAGELGGTQPWIPHMLEIESQYYAIRTPGNGPDFIEFKNAEHEVVYAIPVYGVREIVRKDSNIIEIPKMPTAEAIADRLDSIIDGAGSTSSADRLIELADLLRGNPSRLA